MVYSFGTAPVHRRYVNVETADGEKSEREKKVSKRDLSITPENSYSDIFLDSMQLMEFLESKKVNDTIWRRMISFYNSRNYQFAWFTSKGFTEQARGFWNLHQYSTTYGVDPSLKDKDLQNRMQELITEEGFTVTPSNKQYLKTELTLTEHFISYVLNNYEEGFIKRKEMERFIPLKKADPVYLADSIITKKHKDDKYYGDVNLAYKALKDQLVNYVAIAKKGGWPVVSVSMSKMKPGATSPDVQVLKQRLFQSGDINQMDTSRLYDGLVTEGVRKFQLRHGYTADGKLTQAQLSDMNIPVIHRIQQILINMGRMA